MPNFEGMFIRDQHGPRAGVTAGGGRRAPSAHAPATAGWTSWAWDPHTAVPRTQSRQRTTTGRRPADCIGHAWITISGIRSRTNLQRPTARPWSTPCCTKRPAGGVSVNLSWKTMALSVRADGALLPVINHGKKGTIGTMITGECPGDGSVLPYFCRSRSRMRATRTAPVSSNPTSHPSRTSVGAKGRAIVRVVLRR